MLDIQTELVLQKTRGKNTKKSHRRNWQSYMMLQIFMMILSGSGLVLLAMDLLVYPYVMLVAAAASLFLFLGTFIIGDRRARNELKRRFHI